MPHHRSVFVSCGQLTDSERALGRHVAGVIEDHGMTAFFAQDIHSAGDLNGEVFRAIRNCDAFLGILQKRGIVSFDTHPSVERSSVWIQQEIAIFAYRMFLEQRSLPIRVYSERGILREGLMQIAIMNPIEFDDSAEVITGVAAWLNGREFEEHAVFARREDLFRALLADASDDQYLMLELIAAHCPGPDDFTDFNAVLRDFRAVVGRSGDGRQAIDTRFNDAFGALRDTLLRTEDDRRGSVRIWIAKQWWLLLLDELRNRGKRI